MLNLSEASPSEDWPLLGNAPAVQLLRRSIQKNMLSHAYMFNGPPGVGKRTLAVALAMTVNCEAEPPVGENVPSAPCGLCSSCGRTRRGEHPDVIEVNLETQAAQNAEAGAKVKTAPAKELKIDTMREMHRTVGLSPHSGRYKVYIIGDAERMNEEAANCLLKTLEEPPPQTVFVLLVADEASVMPTIASRCVQVALRPVPRPILAEYLVRSAGADRDGAEKLAALSGGRPGWALSALKSPLMLEQRKAALQEAALVPGSARVDRINMAAKYAKMFSDARPELYSMLEVWEGWWRDLAAVTVGAPDVIVNVDQADALNGAARRITLRDVRHALSLVQATRQQLQENVNPRLALESLMLGLP